jgi:hypothetical protein
VNNLTRRDHAADLVDPQNPLARQQRRQNCAILTAKVFLGDEDGAYSSRRTMERFSRHREEGLNLQERDGEAPLAQHADGLTSGARRDSITEQQTGSIRVRVVADQSHFCGVRFDFALQVKEHFDDLGRNLS